MVFHRTGNHPGAVAWPAAVDATHRHDERINVKAGFGRMLPYGRSNVASTTGLPVVAIAMRVVRCIFVSHGWRRWREKV